METKLLEIGKIVRPHGVKGAVKVQKYLDADFSLFKQVFIGQKLQPAKVLAVSNLNNDACVLTLNIIAGCEAAEKFRSLSVYIDREQYPEFKDKLYLSDLIGKPLLSKNGLNLGTLVDFDDYGASIVLTFNCGGVSYQIPYVDEIVTFNYDLMAFIIDEQTFKDVRV